MIATLATKQGPTSTIAENLKPMMSQAPKVGSLVKFFIQSPKEGI
jgi:hypothetical protein